jgi:hypothetical protein
MYSSYHDGLTFVNLVAIIASAVSTIAATVAVVVRDELIPSATLAPFSSLVANERSIVLQREDLVLGVRPNLIKHDIGKHTRNVLASTVPEVVNLVGLHFLSSFSLFLDASLAQGSDIQGHKTPFLNNVLITMARGLTPS